MKIGIISDTHDDVASMKEAYEQMKAHGIDVLVHCGGLCTGQPLP